jgi:hypothetical protein
MARPGEEYPSDPAVLPGYAGYGSIAWKRAMLAKRLAEAGAYPKNIGEGIASAGRDIGNVLMAKSLQEEERNQAAGERRLLGGEPTPAATAALPDERRDVVRPTAAVDEQLPPTAQATSALPAPSGFTGANDDPYRDAPVQQASATTPDAAMGVEAQPGRARLAALLLQQQQQRALTGNMGGQPLAGARSMQPNSPPGELNPATVFDPLRGQPQAAFIPYDENNPPPVPRYFNGASSEPAAMPVSQPAAPAGSTSPIQLAAAGGFPAPDTPPPASPQPAPERLAQVRDYTFAPRGIPGPPLPTMPPAGNAPGTPPTPLPGVRRAPVIANQAIYGEGVPAPFEVQTPPHPGERPKPPAFPAPTPAMQYWQRVHAADISPEGKEFAKNQYAIHAENQKRAYELGLNEYYHQRGQYDTKEEAYQKGQRELPIKQLEVTEKRLAIAKAMTQDPVQLQKLEADLDNTRAELVLKRQQAVKPETQTVEGKVYERPPGSPAGTPFTRAPGVEEPDKLTEHQQAMLQYFQTATVANRQLPKDESITGLRETLTGKIPVLGNYTLSPEFRNYKRAADSWLLAHVRNQSGAVIGRDEIKNYWGLYFPEPGDDKQELLNKQERRDTLTGGLYNALGGGAAKTAADNFLKDLKAKDEVKYPEGTTRTSKSTGNRQILRGGKWEDM